MAGDTRRSGPNKKGTRVGTGGHGRKALEGRGPTPKAEDRTYHAAHKRKAAAERAQAKTQRPNIAGGPRGRVNGDELVTGRNAVVEALRARVPASALYLAVRAEMDDRMREAIAVASHREIPVLEVTRQELDRLTGGDLLNQGIALSVRPYEYAHAADLVAAAHKSGRPPLLVALDGVTDPRNLGAIIRSVAAFGGHGVLLPARRSAGITAAAWRSSAGAVARVPVAQAPNLAQALTAYKQQGLFIAGLDGDGDTSLPGLALSDRPLVIVVGSEGVGLSRIVRNLCDVVVSIPIGAATESLNAGIATAVALYEVATLRSGTRP